MDKNWKIETLAVQGGYEPGNGDPRIVPIAQSTTFKYDDAQSVLPYEKEIPECTYPSAMIWRSGTGASSAFLIWTIPPHPAGPGNFWKGAKRTARWFPVMTFPSPLC